MSDIFDQLATVIVKKASKVDAKKITLEITLGTLGVDSLAEVEIAQEMEQRLGFPIDDTQFVSRTTIGEIVDYLHRKEDEHLKTRSR